MLRPTLVVSAVLLVRAVAGVADVGARAWLTGRLLVATDEIGDPRFARTVIYMVRHDEQGALGLVINRPLGDVALREVLGQLDREAPPQSGTLRVHWGGPVEPRRGAILHTPDWSGEGTTVLDGGFALTSQPAIFEAMARGAGPRRSIFVLGYAGWAPGQLEAEIERRAWSVARADEALVFDDDPDRKWNEARARPLTDL